MAFQAAQRGADDIKNASYKYLLYKHLRRFYMFFSLRLTTVDPPERLCLIAAAWRTVGVPASGA